MTQEQKVIRAKVGILKLARQLGSVSQACRIIGYSRRSFYRFKELCERRCTGAYSEKMINPSMPHRTAPQSSSKDLDLTENVP